MTAYDEVVPEGSEQLDQLDSDVSLIDRGVADPLDEGYVTAEKWSPAQGFGNTVAEMRQGETLEQRIAQEIPELVVDDSDWRQGEQDRECGTRRAGRLIAATHEWPGEDAPAEDALSDAFGEDVGIDGGAASAEEAAMHIIDDEDPESDELT